MSKNIARYKIVLIAALLSLVLPTLAAPTLSPIEKRVVAAADAEKAYAIQLLETLVNINSGTLNFAGVARVGKIMHGELEPLGFKVRWVPMTSVGRAGHLIAEHKGS